MPSPGDPSFDRRERAARAKRAASDASGERQAELRSKYLVPAPSTKRREPSEVRARPPIPAKSTIDSSAIARTARAALDKHPATWTSYAELCSATGLTRGLALVVARLLVFEPTGAHWFRIRDEEGVYNVPSEDAGEVELTGAEADRRLTSIGVAVVDGRADPERKLTWTGNGWTVRDPG